MKRLFSIKTFAVAVAMASVLASCEEDSDSPSSVKLFTDAMAVKEADGAITFGVQLDHPTTKDLTVNYSTAGTATSGKDYVLEGSSTVIKAGETNGKITVDLIDDNLLEEGAETVVVTLTSADGVSASGTITLSIEDDDCEFVAADWVGDYNADEYYPSGGHDGPYTVTLSQDEEDPNTFHFTKFWNSGASATAYVTFDPETGTVSFPDQEAGIGGEITSGPDEYNWDACTHTFWITTHYDGYTWEYHFAKK